MLTLKYYLDNKGIEAEHSLEIYDADGYLIASSGVQKIDSEYGTYNFIEMAGGIKFKSELSGRWDTNYRFLIDDISFAKNAAEECKKDYEYSENLWVVNGTEENKNAGIIIAAYDAEKRLLGVSLTQLTLEPGEKAVCDNVILKLPVKDEYFAETMVWDGFTLMKPVDYARSADEYGYGIITLK